MHLVQVYDGDKYSFSGVESVNSIVDSIASSKGLCSSNLRLVYKKTVLPPSPSPLHDLHLDPRHDLFLIKAPTLETRDETVTLPAPSQLRTAVTITTSKWSIAKDISSSSNLSIVISHGLGRRHEGDEMVDLMVEGATALATNLTCASYTARGHGVSSGWEGTAITNPSQFTWECLAKDILALSHHYSLTPFVAYGHSMGSAASLFAAMEAPGSVLGLVMMMPPTAWESREGRRGLLEKAGLEGSNFKFVLQGAALSDLPDPMLEADRYLRITCPVLLLAVEGDLNHPVSTAQALHRAIPHSKLHISASKTHARNQFPQVIAAFLSQFVPDVCFIDESAKPLVPPPPPRPVYL